MTHLKPRSTTVTIYQGDDMDRLAHLKRAADIAERQLAAAEDAAKKSGNARAGDDTSDDITAAQSAVGAARDAFDKFVDDATGRALSVVLHTIGSEFFRDLVAEHPPRMVKRKVAVPQERALGEDESPGPIEVAEEEVEHPDDAEMGVNIETFGRALLTFRKMVEEDGEEPELVATIAEPEFTSDAKVKRFVNRELSEGDFDGLWMAAFLLNRGGSQDPKVLVYSPTGSRSTDGT